MNRARLLLKKLFSISLIFTLLPILAIQVANPQVASAAACSSGATSGVYTISPAHGAVFYIDTGITPRLDAAYAGYKISASSAKSNLWVKLSNFTGGKVTLANESDALQQIPSLSAGSANAKTAFFLLKASGTSTTTDQVHTMTLYEGNPNRGGTSIYTCDFTFTELKETIKASANKVQTISVPSNNPSLGSLVSVVVTGTMGNPGNGSSPDNDIIWVSPAGVSTWPTSALRLESTSLILDQDANFSTTNDQNTYNNQLLVSGIASLKPGSSNSQLNTSSQYKATYNFRVIGAATSAFKVVPVAQISSGTQYKHSDTTSTASGAFPTLNLSGVSSTMTVAKRISPIAKVTNVSLTSNVATLTTSEAHGLSTGDTVYVSGSGNDFNGEFIIASTPSSTTLTYSKTASNVSSTALSPNGFVYKKDSGTSSAIIPYEVQVSSTATTNVDEIIDIPDSGMSFVASSAQIKDVDRTSYTSISDPVEDSTESALTPRPKHFTGPFSATSSTSVYLRYKMLVPTTSSATYTNTLYAKSGTQIVGATASANPKVEITTTSAGISGTSETTANATPTVTTSSVTSLGSTTATITGSTDPNGNSISIKFQYGTTSNLSSPTDATASTTSSDSTTTVNLSSNLTGLSSDTLYYYRAVITYVVSGVTQTLYGDILSFRTNLVGSTSQTITWPLSTLTYTINDTTSIDQATNTSDAGATYTSGAVYASSGLLVDLTSSTESVCTISTASTDSATTYTINFLTTGTCTVTASQSGNSTYAAATSVTKNITINKKFTVTFDGNSPTSGSPTASSLTQSTVGGSLTLTTKGSLAKTGYTFSGWNEDSGGTGTNRSESASYTPTADITLYAKWALNSYTVTYNNGTYGTGGPLTQSFNHGSSVTLKSTSSPTITRTGYTLSGWATSNGGSLAYNLGATYSTNSDVSLYPVWTINTYTVTYHTDGADNPSAGVPATPTTYNYNDSVTVANNTTSLAKSGYTFSGWNENSAGTGTDRSVGSTFNISANVDLYPHWVLIGSNTVTFYKNDGTATTSSQSATSTTNLQSNSFTRSGYTFRNWNTNSGGTGSTYTNGQSYSFSANLDLYAQWNQIFTVSYNSNSGGTAPNSDSCTENVDCASSITLPTQGSMSKSGYTFNGWTTTCDSGTVLTGSYTITSSLTLCASWTLNATYSVTYDGNTNTSGSAPSDSNSYNSGDTVTVLTNSGSLSLSGYTFDGWCTTQPAAGSSCGGTSRAASSTFTITANVTLYAVWQTVSSGGGGSSPAPAPVYVPNPPTITSIEKAPVCSKGSYLTINGTYLSGAKATVDGKAAQTVSSSSNSIYVYLPALDEGIKTLVVTNSDGTASTSVKYVYVANPVFQALEMKQSYKNRSWAYVFSASDAESWKINGQLPAGLVLDPNTGLISGMPTVEGIFVISISATNLCGTSTISVTLDIDKEIPNAYSCRISFPISSSNSISELKLAKLKQCFDKIKEISPRTIDPVTFLSGGLKPYQSLEEAVSEIDRYNIICELLTSAEIDSQIITGVFTGPEDEIELMAYWPEPEE